MNRFDAAQKLFSATALLIAVGISGCSSAKKKDTPELSEYEGKKIALVSVEGKRTAKKLVEVALINQLQEKGTFIIVRKEDIDSSRRRPEQDPTDWQGIARGAGADFGLRLNILRFEAETHAGYSKEKVYDSQLAEDMGEDHGETERLYKVRSLDGLCEVDVEFTNLSSGETRKAIAKATDRFIAEGNRSAPHLPPKLRFLEKICNEAFRQFFEDYR